MCAASQPREKKSEPPRPLMRELPPADPYPVEAPRILATAPDPASGTRMWREASPESDFAMKRYGARLLDILDLPLPLAEGARNELAPRTLPLSAQARASWIGFYNHIEVRLGAGGELEPVRGLANKLPEHAARFAAVFGVGGQHRRERSRCR
jgi:hypothetical protein